MSRAPKRSREDLLELLDAFERMTSELGDALEEFAARRKAEQGASDGSAEETSPALVVTTDTPPSREWHGSRNSRP